MAVRRPARAQAAELHPSWHRRTIAYLASHIRVLVSHRSRIAMERHLTWLASQFPAEATLADAEAAGMLWLGYSELPVAATALCHGHGYGRKAHELFRKLLQEPFPE